MSEIRDQIFHRTEVVKTPVQTEPTLEMSQEIFPLCEADFLRLKSPGSKTLVAGLSLCLAGFGFFLSPIAKYIQAQTSGKPVAIEPWEWYAPLIGLAIGVVLCGLARILPNNKRRILQDITDHFAAAPRKHRIQRNSK